MKKILILLVCGIFFWGCSEKEPEKKEVTFMVYMAADNSLSEFAELDIDEMERAVFDPASANVIVQADFSIYAEDSSCRRWKIIADSLYDYQISSPVIQSLGEVDTGNWQSLKSFYNWCVSEYPAERYVLSIWSHGNDWYSYPTNPNKFCPDHDDSNYFDIDDGDLKNAVSGFKEKPDLLIIDACHMQSVQILAEVYTKCNYFCSSPDVVPTDGFPYDDIITEVCSTRDYSNVPELYVSSYIPGGSQNLLGELNEAVCAGLVDCENFSDTVLPEFQDMVSYLLANPDFYPELMNVRSQCLEFNDLNLDIDIVQFLYLLTDYIDDQQLNEYAENLRDNFVENSSFYNYPAYNVGNILITFPEEENMQTWNDLKGDYNKLSWDELTGWSRFLDLGGGGLRPN